MWALVCHMMTSYWGYTEMSHDETGSWKVLWASLPFYSNPLSRANKVLYYICLLMPSKSSSSNDLCTLQLVPPNFIHYARDLTPNTWAYMGCTQTISKPNQRRRGAFVSGKDRKGKEKKILLHEPFKEVKLWCDFFFFLAQIISLHVSGLHNSSVIHLWCF